MIDFFTFEFGLSLGLIIGFLLSYVLHLKNLYDVKRHRDETNVILGNVKTWLKEKDDKKRKGGL